MGSEIARHRPARPPPLVPGPVARPASVRANTAREPQRSKMPEASGCVECCPTRRSWWSRCETEKGTVSRRAMMDGPGWLRRGDIEVTWEMGLIRKQAQAMLGLCGGSHLGHLARPTPEPHRRSHPPKLAPAYALGRCERSLPLVRALLHCGKLAERVRAESEHRVRSAHACGC